MQIFPALTTDDFAAFRLLLDEMAEWDAAQTRALGLDPAALLAICYSDDAAALQAAFTAPGATMFLARIEGAIAGCAGYSTVAAGLAELEKVFVRPVFRGRGLGSALLTQVMAAIEGEGLREVQLETASFMTDAIASYRRFGFTPCPPFRDPMPGLENGTVFMRRGL